MALCIAKMTCYFFFNKNLNEDSGVFFCLLVGVLSVCVFVVVVLFYFITGKITDLLFVIQARG